MFSNLSWGSLKISYKIFVSWDNCLPFVWFSGFFPPVCFIDHNDCISGQLRGQLRQHLSVILCVILFTRYILLFPSSKYFPPFPAPQRWKSAPKNKNGWGKFLLAPIAHEYYLIMTIRQTGKNASAWQICVVTIAPEISRSKNGNCWESKLPPKRPIKAPKYTLKKKKQFSHIAIIRYKTHKF